MLTRITLFFAVCLVAWAQPASTESLKSPDGSLEAVVSDQGGQLAYEVNFRGKPLLLRSRLGLDLQGQPVLGPALHIASAKRGSADESYPVLVGKANPVRNHFNSLTVELAEKDTAPRKLTLELRAYDDGIAFRYVVPQQEAIRQFRLAKELTEFHIAKDATAYPLYLKNYRTSYENIFVKSQITRIPQNQIVGLPLLMEVPGVAWLAIAEADLDHYAGMYLTAGLPDRPSTSLAARLSPDIEEPELAVTGTLPHNSPWRVLLVGAEPGRLIESTTIFNLNPPSAIADTSWIKGGKSAWDWWADDATTGAGFDGGMDTRTMKYYIDFAAKAGLTYMLIDAGWSAEGDVTATSPRIDMPDILRHASEKNVKVWLWLHWTSVDRQMEQAFPLYQKWGVAGVKIDFMDSNDQRMVDFYHRVVKSAAEHHLMVDFHGAYPPTGLQRTWPNLLTHEGVLGLEYNKWSAVPDPDHNVMLAFTRMLAGPADYTPGGFNNVTKADFVPRMKQPMVMGTRAHQLALYVVFESPLVMVSDQPDAYKDQPAFQFIQDVPTTWNETRVVAARVGEYVSVARRHGEEWFLGTITNWDAREIEVPLSFLGSGKYVAEIYADAADSDRAPKNVSIRKEPVEKGMMLKIRLAPGGGNAVRIRR